MINYIEIETKWNPKTRNYYENLGYIYTKHNDTFIVDFEHLHPGSNIEINFICDNCLKYSTTRHSRYCKNKQKYNRDLCTSCHAKLRINNRISKAKNKDDFGYYATHENRKLALNDYLEKYKTLNNMILNDEGRKLYDNFWFHKDSIYDAAVELGYILEDICGNIPNNYYNEQIYKDKLNNFVKINNRFPTWYEIQKILRINTQRIAEIGGTEGCKKLINYNDEKDLIDLRGDYNRSFPELFTANFLCSHGLNDYYKREQHPFPKIEGKYRSDFTFYTEDKNIHIETWGVPKNSKQNEKHIEYNRIRKIKESLYKKYNNNIILIGINYDVFNNTYDKIQEKLYELLSPYLNLKYKIVEYENLLNTKIISDKELYDKCFEYSKDGIHFPTTAFLLKNKQSGLYFEILKRGYSLSDFVHKFNGILEKETKSWSKDLIFYYFDKIIKEGNPINRKNIDKATGNLQTAIQKYGGYVSLKLEFIKLLGYIPTQEIEWVKNISEGINKYNMKITEDDIILSKQLINT